ncbi:MAG: hypothetical protein ABIV51_02820, partial [Saprospiraceae bacterium]
MYRLITILGVVTLLPFIVRAQSIDNNGANSAINKKVELSSLGNETSSGDVDLFSGIYQQNINLGAISTTGGIQYSFALSYASTLMAGTNMPLTLGIPYGEGWNLNVPTISIAQTEVNHIFDEYYQEPINNDYSAMFKNDADCLKSLEEGRLYYASPVISVNGIEKATLIFKEVSGDHFVFVPEKFTEYFEAYLYPGNSSTQRKPVWVVKDNRGVEYMFPHVLFNYSNAANVRVFDNSCVDNNEVAGNLYGPKTTFTKWYCSVIRDPFVKDSIVFTYDGAGDFDMIVPAKNAGLKIKDEAGMIGYPLAGRSYTDLYLRSAVSSRNFMKFDYSTLPYDASHNIPIPPDGDYIENDSFYITKNIGTDFSKFSRYNHCKVSDLNNDGFVMYPIQNSKSPYIFKNPNTNQLTVDRPESDDFHLAFSRTSDDMQVRGGFLQSNSIAEFQFVAGDLYRIGYGLSGNVLDKALFDIRLAYGANGSFIGSPPEQQETKSITLNEYDNACGKSAFSTFSLGLKPLFRSDESGVGAVVFTMPNISPSKFGDFFIEIGPGSSEMAYDYDPVNTLSITPCAGNYYHIESNQDKPIRKAPRFFGNGYPWFGVKNAIPSAGFCGPTNNNWWRREAYINNTRPFRFANAYLESLTLQRISKLPRTLQSVTKYQRDTLNVFRQVGQVSLTYTIKSVANYSAYYTPGANNGPVVYSYSQSTKRNIILLKSIDINGVDNSVSLHYNFDYEEIVFDRAQLSNELRFTSINPFILSLVTNPLGKSVAIKYKDLDYGISPTGSYYFNDNYRHNQNSGYSDINSSLPSYPANPVNPVAIQLYFVVDNLQFDQKKFSYKFSNLKSVLNYQPTVPNYLWDLSTTRESGFESCTKEGPLAGAGANYSTYTFSIAANTMFGKLLSSSVYDANSTIVTSEVNTYYDLLVFSHSGGSGPHPDFKKNGMFYDVPRYGPSRKTGYQLTSHFIPIKSKTASSYESNGTLNTTTNFAYYGPSGGSTEFGYCLLQSTSMINSDGSTQSMEYKYSRQLSDGLLTGRGIYSIPLESTKNSGLAGGTKVIYAVFGDNLLPQNVFSVGRRSSGEGGCEDGSISGWTLQKTNLAYSTNGDLTSFRAGCDGNPVVLTIYANGWIKSSNYINRKEFFNYNNAGSPTYHYGFDGQIEKYTYDGLNQVLSNSARFEQGVPKRLVNYEYVYGNGSGINALFETKNYAGFQEQKTTTKFSTEGQVFQQSISNATSSGGYIVNTNLKDLFNADLYISTGLGANGIDSMFYENSSRHRLLIHDVASTDRNITYLYGVNQSNESPPGYSEGSLLRTTMRDEQGNLSKTFTDRLNRVVMVSRFNTSNPLWVNETKTYNLNGQVASIKNSSNESYDYAYYPDGLLSSKSIPGSGTHVYKYDNRGRMNEWTDPAGNKHTYTYTDYGEAYQEFISDKLVRSITYGTAGIETGKVIGEDKKVFGSSPMMESYHYKLDAFGRIDSIWWNDYSGASESVGFTFENHMDLVVRENRYHARGNEVHKFAKLNLFYPNGQIKETLMKIDAWPEKTIAKYSYDGKLRITGKSLGITNIGSLQDFAYEYHPRGWLSKINGIVLGGEPIPACQLKPEEQSLCGSIAQFLQGIQIQIQFNLQQVNSNPPMVSIGHTRSILYHGSTYGVTPPTTKTTWTQLNGGVTGHANYNTTIVLNQPNLLVTTISRGRDIQYIIGQLDSLLKAGLINQTAAEYIKNHLQEILNGDFPYECKEVFKPQLKLHNFAEEIRYDDPHGSSGGSAQHNGNISQVIYQFANNLPVSYGFRYDMLNRLTQSTFAEIIPNGEYSGLTRFDETVGYADATGNISSIRRNGITGQCEIGYQFGPIDQLTMTYSQGKLEQVQENIQSNKGFPPVTGSYTYDGMGRITF